MRRLLSGRTCDQPDEVYDDLKKVFSEEEIIEPGQLYAQSDGGGKLVKCFNVMSWGEACEISPDLTKTKNAIAAE